jgi:hypothetical protein
LSSRELNYFHFAVATIWVAFVGKLQSSSLRGRTKHN